MTHREYNSLGNTAFPRCRKCGNGSHLLDQDGECPMCSWSLVKPLLYQEPSAPRDPGVKYDQGKTRMDLLPMDALEGVAEVLTFGANKYGDRNWENGLHHGRLWGALLRHMGAHMKGEFYDRETGLAHVKHAACCMLMLLAHVLRGVGTDDITGSFSKVKNEEGV